MYCTNCGYKNEDDAKFCGNCGHALVKTQEKTGTSKPKNKKNRKWIAAVGTVIAAVALAVFVMSKLRPRYDFIGEYNEYGLAVVQMKDKYGYINEKKKVVIPVEYDRVGEFDSNRLVIVEQEGKSGIYDAIGNEVVPTDYSNIVISKQNSESGLLPIELGEEMTFFNEENQYVYDSVIPSSADGYFIVSDGENRGCVDRYGAIKLPCIYRELDIICPLSDKLKVRIDGSVNYMLSDGTLLYDEVGEENGDGLAIVRNGENYGCINEQADEIIPVRYREVSVGEKLKNGYFPVTINGTNNFMNLDGNMLYVSVGNYAENGLAAAGDDYGFYGYIDQDGTEVIPFNYDGAGDFGSNGLAKVKIGDHYGYINKLGISVIETKYDYASDFSENGHAFVQEGYAYNFISEFGGEQYEYVTEVKNDFSIAKKDGKYGIVDKEGNLLTAVWYDKIYDEDQFLEEGIVRARTGGKYVLLNSRGEEITDYYDGIRPELYGKTVACWRDGKYGLVGINGEEVTALKYAEIGEYGYEGLIATLCYFDGTTDFMNVNSRIIVSGEYQWVYSVGNHFIAYDGEKYILIDSNGKIIKEDIGESVSFFSEDIPKVAIKQYGIWNIYDEEGNQMLELDFSDIWCSMSTSEYIVGSDLNGKYGIWDWKGEEIIPCQYDSIVDIENEQIMVKLNGKYGIINMKNDLIIPASYDSISIGKNGFIVMQDNYKGIYSLDGTEVLPVEYDDIWCINEDEECGEGLYYITIDELYGIYDGNGDPVIPVEYTNLFYYPENDGVIRTEDENEMWDLWDKNGNVLISDADWISGVGTNGLVTVMWHGGDEYYFDVYDTAGRHKYSLDYDNASIFYEGLAAVKQDGKWGFVNTKGELVIDCIYEDYELFSGEGVAAVMQEGKWGYIDEEGNQLTEFIYSEAGEMKKGMAVVANSENKKGLLGISMNEIVPCEYDDIYKYSFLNEVELVKGNREIDINEAGNVLREILTE